MGQARPLHVSGKPGVSTRLPVEERGNGDVGLPEGHEEEQGLVDGVQREAQLHASAARG